MNIRKGDLLILVVLMLIGTSLLYYHNFNGHNKGNTAVLEINGEIIEEFSLNDQTGFYNAETEQGYNLIEFENGKVRVKESNCPEQICVQFGWAQHVGQTIVCLPHKLIIRIENISADHG